MFGDDFNAEDMQAAALEAARRVRDHCLKLTGPENPITSGLPDGLPNGDEISIAIESLDDAALARIIGDAPAGEVMPNAPDSRNRGGDVAVGEEALQREDAPAVIREMTDKVPVSGQPSAGCGTAEPPRLQFLECRHGAPIQRGSYCEMCKAYDEGQQAERARAVGIIKSLLAWGVADLINRPWWEDSVKKARAYLAEAQHED